MSKTSKSNSPDNRYLEEMRKIVLEQELSARSWKANYEKMYYTIEAEKLEEEYRKCLERMAKRFNEERKKEEELILPLNNSVEQNQENNGS